MFSGPVMTARNCASGTESARLAAQGLHARYVAANGAEPALVTGATAGQSGDVFSSTAQLVEAMRDPRYAADPAYRATVEAKLARSSIF